MGVLLITFVTFVNYKDTRRNKTENYFLGLLVIMGVLLILLLYPLVQNYFLPFQVYLH
jgi:hypothetical protein